MQSASKKTQVTKNSTPLEVRSASGSQLLTKGLEQRTKIIKQATREILDSGVEKLVMRQLATDVDMKLGNLQYYFATKEDLLEGVLLYHAKADLEIIVRAGETLGFKGVIKELLLEWQNGVVQIFPAILVPYKNHSRFADLRSDIYIDFYRQLVALMIKEDIPGSKQTLHTRAKLITTMLDGAVMQDHSSIGSADSDTILKNYNNQVLKLILKIARGEA